MKQSLLKVGLMAVVILCSLTALAQQIDWSKTKNWKIYDLGSVLGLEIPVDSLQYIKSAALEDSVMRSYMCASKQWPLQKYSVWMGVIVTSYETNKHGTRKLLVSTYGGFVYDEKTKRYYELPEEMRERWIEYLDAKRLAQSAK